MLEPPPAGHEGAATFFTFAQWEGVVGDTPWICRCTPIQDNQRQYGRYGVLFQRAFVYGGRCRISQRNGGPEIAGGHRDLQHGAGIGGKHQ